MGSGLESHQLRRQSTEVALDARRRGRQPLLFQDDSGLAVQPTDLTRTVPEIQAHHLLRLNFAKLDHGQPPFASIRAITPVCRPVFWHCVTGGWPSHPISTVGAGDLT